MTEVDAETIISVKYVNSSFVSGYTQEGSIMAEVDASRNVNISRICEQFICYRTNTRMLNND